MRQIGVLSDADDARRFEDYLLTLGIRSMVEEDTDGWCVWVYNEDKIPEAKEELAAFNDNANAAKYQGVDEVATGLRQEQQQQAEQARKAVVDVRQQWSQSPASRGRVTFAMIAFSVLVVALATDWNTPGRLCDKQEPLVNALSIASQKIRGRTIHWNGLQEILHGQVWRTVTPIFLHFSILHILFNMLMLRALGIPVEMRRGSLRYALIVLFIAITSNLGQYAASDAPNFGGMSGVVYGLFGYIWMKSRFDPNSGFYMPPNIVFWMIGWFLICFTGAVGNIANTAHGVGLAAGAFLGYAPTLWRDLTRG